MSNPNPNTPPEVTPEQIAVYQDRERRRLRRGEYVALPESWTGARWFIYGMPPDQWQVAFEAHWNSWDNASGRYTIAAPDTFKTTAEHFAHVSMADGAMIAFTETHAKGVADRQTRMKAGKYLKKFYGHCLTELEIRDLATDFGAEYAPMELQFASDADAIEHVYIHGPSSCMSYRASNYRTGGVHPTRTYAGPDLQIAYIAKSEDEITARCVVWPAKKWHGRIYGDERRIKPLLDAADYKLADLDGARLTAIDADNGGYIVPYVDCCRYACDRTESGYLVLGSGSVNLRSTDGCSGPSYSCEACSDGLTEDEACTIDGRDGCYCEHCYSELTVYCADVRESRDREDAVEMANGNYWSQRGFDLRGFTCPIMDTRHPESEGVEVDGELWSQEAFDGQGFTCAGSGLNYSRAVMVVMADGALWSQDYFAENGHILDGENVRNEDAPVDAVRYRCADTLEMDLVPPTVQREIEVGARVQALHYGGSVDCWHIGKVGTVIEGRDGSFLVRFDGIYSSQMHGHGVNNACWYCADTELVLSDRPASSHTFDWTTLRTELDVA